MANSQNKSSFVSKPVVLIGMPGAGKSSVGRKLAAKLGCPFVDSDQEIEASAGMAIPQIFETYGEPAFRDGERKVIARLLRQGPMVLSTGGGAFMNEETRELIKSEALSFWIKAAFDILLERVLRTNDRPLLRRGDPATILRELMTVREPVYALADLTVLSDAAPIDVTVQRILEALDDYSKGHNA